MKEYKFLIRKIQEASVTEVCSGNETVEEMIKKIEDISEEELEFSEPEYQLVAISKKQGKIAKLLWFLR